jgi:hypothetical protein
MGHVPWNTCLCVLHVTLVEMRHSVSKWGQDYPTKRCCPIGMDDLVQPDTYKLALPFGLCTGPEQSDVTVKIYDSYSVLPVRIWALLPKYPDWSSSALIQYFQTNARIAEPSNRPQPPPFRSSLAHNSWLSCHPLRRYAKVYPKVSGLATWGENCKWYSSLPLRAAVALFCDSV